MLEYDDYSMDATEACCTYTIEVPEEYAEYYDQDYYNVECCAIYGTVTYDGEELEYYDYCC